MKLTSPRVITFGTFDLFHIGHVNILRRSRELGSSLIVGVSSDGLNFKKKNLYPVFPEAERLAIIGALRFVDEVFVEESLELKGEYITRYAADILVMGDDWAGRFDEFKSLCDVVYLPRTEGISTTHIKRSLSQAT
jgi:glycerol-3-phosphate cytidylyltransferase